ncbi:MAG: NAD-dependent epimerase/dehydratase family protein [Alphaproteobacteria bacterium]|nr:NAD-dependent epimerase/dehydratase family protein [Alphaproteobacteria bacterium]
MTILVTGGCGFIGNHLVKMLVQNGEQVRILDLSSPPSKIEGVEYIQGSITDIDTVAKAMKGARYLYHVAANPNLWTKNKKDFHYVNYMGTKIVLDKALKHNVEKVVYTSTESILSAARIRTKEQRQDHLTDETAEPVLGDMPGPYCRSKFLAEQEAFNAVKQGLPVVIVNPTLPIGPGDYKLTPPSKMILNFLNGLAPAYLDCALNFIDVRDAAMGHILALRHGEIGERYILGHTNLYLHDLLQKLSTYTKRSMPKVKIPYAFAYMVALVNEVWADYISRRPPIAPLTGVRLTKAPMSFDSAKAKQELGLTCRSLDISLKDAIDEWKNRGLLQPSLLKEI